MDISELINNLKEFDSKSRDSNGVTTGVNTVIPTCDTSLSKRPLNERLTFINAILAPYNIKFRCEKISDDQIGRIILTQSRNQSDFTNPITFQCNGLILDSTNWKVLAVPCCAFNPRSSLKKIEALYKENKYKLYKIYDGTIINLYHYNDKWILGTTNSYEMNDCKFMGSKTYMGLLSDIIKQYPEFSFEKLDIHYSYCIGFKHQNMHLFSADKQKAWFIQKTNLETMVTDYTNITGLENQGIITEKPNFDTLIETNNKALRNYLKEFRIDFGYILRGEFAESKEQSNILLESTLLKKIRQLIYNFPRELTMNLTNENRLGYIILRAYLNYSNRKIFIDLFPQYQRKFDEYKELINNLVTRIVQCYRNSNIKLTNDKKIDQLANIFIGYINREGRINSFNDNCKSIIYDYATDIEYIDIYRKILEI